MGTADDHERTLTVLNASGVIAPTSPLASTANPLWWNGRTPTPPRQLLHKQLVRELYDTTPALAHDRQAILLAGPPGAGKSTALGNVLTPEERARYLHLPLGCPGDGRGFQAALEAMGTGQKLAPIGRPRWSPPPVKAPW